MSQFGDVESFIDLDQILINDFIEVAGPEDPIPFFQDNNTK